MSEEPIAVTLRWTGDADTPVHFPIPRWPSGVPIPQRGELLRVPDEDFLHTVTQVCYTIDRAPIPAYWRVSMVEIETVRSFREANRSPDG